MVYQNFWKHTLGSPFVGKWNTPKQEYRGLHFDKGGAPGGGGQMARGGLIRAIHRAWKCGNRDITLILHLVSVWFFLSLNGTVHLHISGGEGWVRNLKKNMKMKPLRGGLMVNLNAHQKIRWEVRSNITRRRQMRRKGWAPRRVHGGRVVGCG